MRAAGHFRLGLVCLGLALLLAGCGSPDPEPDTPPSPALWQIENAEGAVEGWLFGTMHALPAGMRWKTAELERVIAEADLLVVEAADLYDGDLGARTMARLANGRDLPPLLERVEVADRHRLASALEDSDLSLADLDRMDTWAAALAVAASVTQSSSGSGADEALVEAFDGRDIRQLEGVAYQLGIFDRLPEGEQRDLMRAVLTDIERRAAEPEALARLWRAGDVDALIEEGERGILADPELRTVLLTERNLDWSEQVRKLLTRPQRPLIAAGAAHMVGDESLPSLLDKRGYRLVRLQ